MTSIDIELVENGPPVEASLPYAALDALTASSVVSITRAGRDRWAIRAGTKVGVVRVGDVTVRIHPKVQIGHLLFMLGYAKDPARWRRPGPVDVLETDDLVAAVADAYSRLAERALLQGVLQGYRTVDSALPVLRGRLRAVDQLRTRFGVPLPLEVTFDEFDTDIAENRILRAAAKRALYLPRIWDDTRHRLHRVLLRLADVEPVRVGLPLPVWQPTRLNARYQAALGMAELIWRGSSFEVAAGQIRIEGFLLDMPSVFEQFVCTALDEALSAGGGTGRGQSQYRTHLDVGLRVLIKPDFVWSVGGRPEIVVDAKYKAEKPAGYPNADVYQMLAYCTALDLRRGHLIYAKGNEVPAVHSVRNCGIEMFQHTIDLSLPPAALLASVTKLIAGLSPSWP